jgi:hypothetical protein
MLGRQQFTKTLCPFNKADSLSGKVFFKAEFSDFPAAGKAIEVEMVELKTSMMDIEKGIGGTGDRFVRGHIKATGNPFDELCFAGT